MELHPAILSFIRGVVYFDELFVDYEVLMRYKENWDKLQ